MGIVSNQPQGRELSQGSFRNSDQKADQKAAWVLWQRFLFFTYLWQSWVSEGVKVLSGLHWKQLKLFMCHKHSSFVKAKDLNTKGCEPWQQSYAWKQWKWYHVSSPILTHPCKMEIESDKPCSWSIKHGGSYVPKLWSVHNTWHGLHTTCWQTLEKKLWMLTSIIMLQICWQIFSWTVAAL
jgi:hypothetical protein